MCMSRTDKSIDLSHADYRGNYIYAYKVFYCEDLKYKAIYYSHKFCLEKEDLFKKHKKENGFKNYNPEINCPEQFGFSLFFKKETAINWALHQYHFTYVILKCSVPVSAIIATGLYNHSFDSYCFVTTVFTPKQIVERIENALEN